MKKILALLSAFLLSAACHDGDEASESILGGWIFTEISCDTVYTESLYFYDTGLFALYGDEEYPQGAEGCYTYDTNLGKLVLYYNSGETDTYLISVSDDRMTLRYIDEEDGPEEPMIFTRMGE